MSVYKIALERTTKTIDTRAKYYRNLIVAVIVLTLGSLGWAAATRTLAPLAGLLLVFPICGFFFFLDERLLANWRSGLIRAWIKKDLDFNGFHQAVDSIPKLPKATLRGMLATLPIAGDLVAEQRISSSTREGAAAAVTYFHRCRSDAIAFKAATAAIISASVIATVATGTWKPFWGCTVLVLIPFLGKWLDRRRTKTMNQRTLATREQADFSEHQYREMIERLRDPISLPVKQPPRANAHAPGNPIQ